MWFSLIKRIDNLRVDVDPHQHSRSRRATLQVLTQVETDTQARGAFQDYYGMLIRKYEVGTLHCQQSTSLLSTTSHILLGSALSPHSLRNIVDQSSQIRN